MDFKFVIDPISPEHLYFKIKKNAQYILETLIGNDKFTIELTEDYAEKKYNFHDRNIPESLSDKRQLISEKQIVKKEEIEFINTVYKNDVDENYQHEMKFSAPQFDCTLELGRNLATYQILKFTFHNTIKIQAQFLAYKIFSYLDCKAVDEMYINNRELLSYVPAKCFPISYYTFFENAYTKRDSIFNILDYKLSGIDNQKETFEENETTENKTFIKKVIFGEYEYVISITESKATYQDEKIITASAILFKNKQPKIIIEPTTCGGNTFKSYYVAFPKIEDLDILNKKYQQLKKLIQG